MKAHYLGHVVVVCEKPCTGTGFLFSFAEDPVVCFGVKARKALRRLGDDGFGEFYTIPRCLL